MFASQPAENQPPGMLPEHIRKASQRNIAPEKAQPVCRAERAHQSVRRKAGNALPRTGCDSA
jgi:hypothetical protein